MIGARRTLLGLSLGAAIIAAGLWQFGQSREPAKPTIREASTPVRIASLTLATDEILAELVPTDRMACLTYLADDGEISNIAGFYPKSIPRLRDSDLEKIISLRPDLVCVAPYNSADFLQMIERSRISVYRNEAFQTMDAIEAGIIELGKRVGEPARAQTLTERMRARREQLATRLRSVARRPGILFWSAGFTAGQASTVDDTIRLAGAVNLAAAKGLKGSVEISPEQVIAIDPEFVLVSKWSGDERESDIENHALLRNLRAVRQGRCLVIEGKYLLSVSQHVVTGAEQLARKLHPECFDEQASAAPLGRARLGAR